jgi:Predicted nucleic acid-binding protein, contains PIN domain
MTGTDRRRRPSRLEGPVYLDTSALVKLYVLEPESAQVDRALRGRDDLLVSDLAVTELASALGRRCREGVLDATLAARIYQRLLADLADDLFRRVELIAEVQREAERFLLSSALVPLRSLDALHLALAASGHAMTIYTFDRNLARAAGTIGLLATPDPAEEA